MASIINTSRIAVAGLGQLGSSLCLRFKEIGCISLFGISRTQATLQAAVDNDIVDGASDDPEEILPVVDITFLCMPLDVCVDVVHANLAQFRPGSIVTDVGSVKQPIVEKLRPMLQDRGVYFVGSHPMAGSEKSGLAHGRRA